METVRRKRNFAEFVGEFRRVFKMTAYGWPVNLVVGQGLAAIGTDLAGDAAGVVAGLKNKGSGGRWNLSGSNS
jgi:hypothetical protein